MMTALPLDLAMVALLSWLGLGLLGFALGGYQTLACRLIFPLSAMGGLLLAAAGLWALTASPDVLQIFGPLPVLPWSFRLDPLAGFFLILLGLLAAAVSVFATGYFRPLPAAALRRLFLQYQSFLLGMGLVLLADNAYTFLVAWEIMAIASYFLVVTEHKEEGSRRAGFLYLLIAHLGALAILLGFAVLAGVQILQGGSFAAMMQAQLSPFWASAAFLLTFFGFGAKAGLLPLHIWLPEAHPAAPAPVSALMSGAMLQTAFYGMLRVDFLFLPQAADWWGPFVLLVGLASALFAVLFAAAQTDMKRLLAYSSIENMGLIMVAMGLALIFRAHGLNGLAALALIAALYHALNHAFFKGLLFLGSGSVLHATGTVAMDRLGGLIQRMPQTAFFMLVGVLAIAGLPPLNGFVSEWLLLQAFLLAPALPQSTLSAVLPLAASGVVLSAALAAYAMVKFYGISFLGQPRAHLPVHEAGRWERGAMGLLAMACVALGLFPGVLIGLLDPVIREMVGQGLGQQGWLWLTPVSAQRASYSPVIFLFGIALALGVAFVLVWWRFGRPLRRAGVWACGFPLRTARMQDSPLGFVEPLLRIFRPVFQLRREALSTAAPRLSLQLGEPVTAYLYRPLAATAAWLSAQMVRLQQGRITVYLLYSFLTLLLLLALLR
jgi:formate hydrogenlyase subunit 3/multisubunit Na+/H+ antiporter MnhD subunit